MLKDKKHTAIDNLLEEVLNTEPEYSLSSSFADKVAAKTGKEYALGQYFREFLIYLGALAGLGGVSAAMVFIWFRTNIQEWLSYLQNNLTLVVGINVVIVFILLADKVLLPYLFYRSGLRKI